MIDNSLRVIREQKGITVAQLAGKTSISIRTLSSYEAGERTIPTEDLRKLSRVLFVTPADILKPAPAGAASAPTFRAPPPEREYVEPAQEQQPTERAPIERASIEKPPI